MITKTFTPTWVRTFTCSVCCSVWEVCEERDICLGCEIDWQNTTVLEYEAQEAAEWGAEQVQVCGVD